MSQKNSENKVAPDRMEQRQRPSDDKQVSPAIVSLVLRLHVNDTGLALQQGVAIIVGDGDARKLSGLGGAAE